MHYPRQNISLDLQDVTDNLEQQCMCILSSFLIYSCFVWRKKSIVSQSRIFRLCEGKTQFSYLKQITYSASCDQVCMPIFSSKAFVLFLDSYERSNIALIRGFVHE